MTDKQRTALYSWLREQTDDDAAGYVMARLPEATVLEGEERRRADNATHTAAVSGLRDDWTAARQSDNATHTTAVAQFRDEWRAAREADKAERKAEREADRAERHKERAADRVETRELVAQLTVAREADRAERKAEREADRAERHKEREIDRAEATRRFRWIAFVGLTVSGILLSAIFEWI